MLQQTTDENWVKIYCYSLDLLPYTAVTEENLCASCKMK